MKHIVLLVLSLFATAALADAQVMRPSDRYVFIGDFTSATPFGYQEDNIMSNVREYARGVVFDVQRGIDVEISDVEIICSRGNTCDRMRGGLVSERRPLFIPFRWDLDVAQVIVRHKPRGFSVPPVRVDTYLELSRGW